MNYRTTCPHCASVFRLGADQLDAAQGWVQCGVCGTAFEARLSLLQENGSALPVEPEPAEITESAAVDASAPEATPPVEALAASPPAPAATDVLGAAAPATDEPPAAEPPIGIAQREASLDLPSIILIDPDLPLAEEPGPLPQIPAAPPASGLPPMYPPTSATAPAAPALPPPIARIEYASPQDAEPQPDSLRAPPSPRRIRPWVWSSASVLLLAVLLAQSAYFLRDTLVSQLPQTRPAFEQACAVLGCTLSLPKNLAQLQIVGSDLQTEASGRLKLTLTLGNRASYAQAWPVLVLTLTDQRNRPLARRSFAPSEYLGDAQLIAAGIPPLSEQPLSLPLAVRDIAPMGFDLQLTH